VHPFATSWHAVNRQPCSCGFLPFRGRAIGSRLVLCGGAGEGWAGGGYGSGQEEVCAIVFVHITATAASAPRSIF